MRIILASKSKFRGKALDILGLEYEAIPSDFDEKSIRDKDPKILAKKLAEAKARSIGEKENDAIIIAADLFVVHNNKVYEKPKDEKEAFEMLDSLSGNQFEIITGLAVYNSSTDKMLSTVEICTVRFRKLLDYEINDYISRYPVLKCSAAFEGDGLLRFAEHVQGKYTFRTGIPVSELILFLRENGLKV